MYLISLLPLFGYFFVLPSLLHPSNLFLMLYILCKQTVFPWILPMGTIVCQGKGAIQGRELKFSAPLPYLLLSPLLQCSWCHKLHIPLLFQIYLLLAEKEGGSTPKSIQMRISNLTKALDAVAVAISRLCIDDDPVCSAKHVFSVDTLPVVNTGIERTAL